MVRAADSVGWQIRLPAVRRTWVGRPRFAGPSDQALYRLAGWYAIALRLGGAVLFAVVAVLADADRHGRAPRRHQIAD